MKKVLFAVSIAAFLIGCKKEEKQPQPTAPKVDCMCGIFNYQRDSIEGSWFMYAFTPDAPMPCDSAKEEYSEDSLFSRVVDCY